MKNIIIGLGVVLVVAAVAVVGMASSQPDRIHFERSVTIDATAADMAPFAEDLRLVNAWSPWNDKDPDLVQTWSDSTTGVGAWYGWTGNDEVGTGKQTISVVEPGKVVHHLEFITPFEDQADAAIMWEGNGDTVDVSWSFEKDSSALGTKVAMLFMDLEAMIAPDYELGLQRLKPMVEAAAEERIAAEAEAERLAAEEAKRLADEAAAMAEDGNENAAP